MSEERREEHPVPRSPCASCGSSSAHEEHLAMTGRWGRRRVFHALICDGCGRTELYFWKNQWFLYSDG